MTAFQIATTITLAILYGFAKWLAHGMKFQSFVPFFSGFIQFICIGLELAVMMS